ncbi:MAG TPA: DUF4157 domain-containing protein [Herpetosiphonaceae bacterium]
MHARLSTELKRRSAQSALPAAGQRPVVRRQRAAPAAFTTLPAIVEAVLHGPGQPLDLTARAHMEPRFGHDFSQVRVHTGALAAQSARALDAHAYTVGQQIVFGAGEYAPGAPAGEQTLAHELTHVVQQSASMPQATASMPDERAEHEAYGSAAALRADRPLSVTQRLPMQIQRLPRDRDPIHAPMIESFREQTGLQEFDEFGRRVGPSDAQIKYRLSPAAQLGSLYAMTPWELAQVPEGRLNLAESTARAMGVTPDGPSFDDYRRARRFVRALHSQYGITFDVEREQRILGRVPTADELTILDRLLGQILGVGNVRQSLGQPGARGVPTATGSTRPSLQGRARILNDLAEYSIKRFQLQWLVAGGYGRPTSEVDRDVRSLWTEQGITPPATAVITEQERRATALVAFRAFAGLEPGFYFPPDDMFYLAPSSNLRTPAVQAVARHEAVHLLGGRERTRRAFIERFGADRYIQYWRPFEEGISELIAIEATPANQQGSPGAPGVPNTQSGYGAYVTLMQRIMNIIGREALFQAFFTGNIPNRIFELLVTPP